MRFLLPIALTWEIVLCGSRFTFAEDPLKQERSESSLRFTEKFHERIYDPFLLPQTTLLIGNTQHQIDLANESSQLNGSGINTYGFDIEVNYAQFLNIGCYFRVESQNIQSSDDINSRFSTLLGGFTRFFYAPAFLKWGSMSSNLFTRLELGGGPVILGGPGGLIAETGISVGIETYFTKWLGFSVSYGQVFEYGKETFITGSNTNHPSLARYKNSSIWSQGQTFLVGLKTTFF
jgi:hypothetical protein